MLTEHNGSQWMEPVVAPHRQGVSSQIFFSQISSSLLLQATKHSDLTWVSVDLSWTLCCKLPLMISCCIFKTFKLVLSFLIDRKETQNLCQRFIQWVMFISFMWYKSSWVSVYSLQNVQSGPVLCMAVHTVSSSFSRLASHQIPRALQVVAATGLLVVSMPAPLFVLLARVSPSFRTSAAFTLRKYIW